MSEFVESVDDLIARHFALETICELRDTGACEIKDSHTTTRILEQLVRSSIAHARSQVEGRRRGTMAFEAAMELVRTRNAMVTRPGWNIFVAVRMDLDGVVFLWELDNCDGTASGSGAPYTPTDEDRAATDWMLYQAPAENWVELNF